MSKLKPCCEALAKWTAAYNTAFSNISNEQYNWKPKADVWSVAECIEHVRLTNASYIGQLDAILNNQYKRPLGSRIPFISYLFGNMISAFVEPTGKKKTKTFPVVEPSLSEYDKVAHLERFNEHQTSLLARLTKLDESTIGRYYMTSPAGGAITYPLTSLLTIIPSHDERHFHQAERTLKAQLD